MDNNLSLLEKEYCPPIDSSLFSAIASDYDLSKAAAYEELRAVLEALKENATAEESAGFDPSGTSGIQDDISSNGSSERPQSWHGDTVASTSGGSEDTDLTGISQTLKDVNIGDKQKISADGLQKDVLLEQLAPAERARVLKEMFPEAKSFDVEFILKKAGNNFSKAVEELLNQAFLTEESLASGEQILRKGIDGFAEETANTRRKRRKGKKQQSGRRTSSLPAPCDDKTINSATTSSRWDCAREDIEFIAQRTYLSHATISSTYHQNGASLSSTIAALCSANESNNPNISSMTPSILESHTADLSLDFPNLPISRLQALIHLTHPSTASAHELAHRLFSTPTATSTGKIIPQYLPRPPSPDPPTTTTSSPRPPLATPTATALLTTRTHAITQASTSHRKSASNPLMSGAAAHYSSIARSASASLRAHESATADALVAAQSKPGEVDLHGVNVQDGIRIARERVEEWWAREGREWAREGKVMGGRGKLRVVTGVGRHSVGGRGRLGPAVGGMLVREGWRVEVGGGWVDVVGRGRGRGRG